MHQSCYISLLNILFAAKIFLCDYGEDVIEEAVNSGRSFFLQQINVTSSTQCPSIDIRRNTISGDLERHYADAM